MSDTPRTDEEMCDGWSGDAFAVSVEFARGLEKQLAEAKTEIEAMRPVVEAAEAYYKGRITAVSVQDAVFLYMQTRKQS